HEIGHPAAGQDFAKENRIESECAEQSDLMYMTTFDNMVSRDEHWKQFFGHPHWKELLEIEEYKHTVSKADIHLLTPTEYSDY
ncbi:MAG: NIPSNAP family protein, partial [Bacteroidota bacterium]